MPDPAGLRDSTQVVLSKDALDGLREGLTEEFTVTVVERDDHARIIGSPVAIKDVTEYLVRHGVPVG